VAHYEGNNYGSTYPGVTPDEVRVLFYGVEGGYLTSRGEEEGPPPGTIVDLAEPPADDEYTFLRLIRAYQQHFNSRYQTYGRFVHFYAHFPSGGSVEHRRADAILGIQKVKPFAIISIASANAAAYVETTTRRRVVTFIGANFVAWQAAEAYRRTPGLLWSYSPSVEQVSRIAGTYVCQKVVPHVTSFGDPQQRGKPRVLGLIRSGDQNRPDHVQYGLEIKRIVEQCGGKFAAEMVSGPCCVASEQDAADLARFRQTGVTTIIWTSGRMQGRTAAATSMQYFPEWVIAGTNQTEGNLAGRIEDQAQWQNARAVTTYLAVERVESQSCYTAAKEADPSLAHTDIRNYGCDFFLGIRQVFIGIQVAGPKLGPPSMDRGFHAIPRVASTDPSVPACYYDDDDYSCVKDSQMQWWDPSGEAPDNTGRGCWRMMQRGRRYVAGTWPEGDVEAQRTPDDPCNLQARDVA
jgi:hypothetical protein